MLLFLFQFLLAAGVLENASFSSPIIPKHSDKFITLGDALPMRKFVRLNPPSSFASGALITSTPVNSSTFELEITINFGSKSLSPYSGAAFLFTNSTFRLGEIFGLASDFKGFAAVIDTHLEKIFLIENYEELTGLLVRNASSCDFKSANKQKVIQLKVLENYFEVLVKDRSFKKCAGIEISNVKFPFFAVASYVGNNTNVLFDVLQIQAKEVEDEETTNKLLRDLDKELGEEVKKLEDKVDMLKNRILDVPGSQEFLKLDQEIKKIQEKIENIVGRVVGVKEKLVTMHLDDFFTEAANEEIKVVKEMIMKMHSTVESLLAFADSNGIIAGISRAVEKQFKVNSDFGNLLKKDLTSAEKTFDSFEISFENDYRLGYLHIGLLIGFVFSVLVCCKIWNTEKVKTIT